MNTLDLYTEKFANWISSGNLVNLDKISSVGIKPSYDKILTKKYIRKIWSIEYIPVESVLHYTEVIEKESHSKYENVKVVVHTYNTPVDFNPNSDTFKRQMSRANDAYVEYEKIYSRMTDSEQQVGKKIRMGGGRNFRVSAKDLTRLRENYISYKYANAYHNSGGQFMCTNLFIEVMVPDKRILKSYCKFMKNTLNQLNLANREVKGNMNTFMENYTFTAKNVKKLYNPMFFSDENLALLSPYRTHGLISGDGILMGVDMKSGQPFNLPLYESGSGQTILMLGKTGSGKTYGAFQKTISLVANNVHCSVVDIKSNEWSKLSPYIDSLILDMSSEGGRFVNTLRLDDLPSDIDPKLAKQFFKSAITSTVRILALMCNLQPSEGNYNDMDLILKQSVSKLYSKVEVDGDNSLTFYRTKHMSYRDILPILSDLTTSKSFTNAQRELCTIIRNRCFSFLQDGGEYADAFANEVTLNEILDTPLIIYSFNKNQEGMLNIIDGIRVFMVDYVDNKKHSLRKIKGLHSDVTYEEVQRVLQFSGLLETIAHRVSGSRSNNVTVSLLMNSLSVLDENAARIIKSNITTVIAGKLTVQDQNIITDDFGFNDLKNNLTLLESPKYEHCLACSFDTGKTKDEVIYKVVFPDYMNNDFSTRKIGL